MPSRTREDFRENLSGTYTQHAAAAPATTQRRHRGGVPGRRGEAGEREEVGPPSQNPHTSRRLQDPRPGPSSPRVRLGREQRGAAATAGAGGAGTPRADACADWPEVSGPHPRAARSLEPGGRGAEAARARAAPGWRATCPPFSGLWGSTLN